MNRNYTIKYGPLPDEYRGANSLIIHQCNYRSTNVIAFWTLPYESLGYDVAAIFRVKQKEVKQP